jgi:hypothetical protein
MHLTCGTVFHSLLVPQTSQHDKRVQVKNREPPGRKEPSKRRNETKKILEAILERIEKFPHQSIAAVVMVVLL